MSERFGNWMRFKCMHNSGMQVARYFQCFSGVVLNLPIVRDATVCHAHACMQWCRRMQMSLRLFQEFWDIVLTVRAALPIKGENMVNNFCRKRKLRKIARLEPLSLLNLCSFVGHKIRTRKARNTPFALICPRLTMGYALFGDCFRWNNYKPKTYFSTYFLVVS